MRGTSTPICARRSRIGATAAAAALVLTVMRTSSEPARASDFTCCAVASASSVSVLVIDCTTMGFAPPTRTRPIATATLLRRCRCMLWHHRGAHLPPEYQAIAGAQWLRRLCPGLTAGALNANREGHAEFSILVVIGRK